MYFVYIIKNSVGKLYVGVTDNPQQRLKEHNSKRSAQYTSRIPTYKIVFLEEYPSMSAARKREIQIKKWRRDKKEILVERYKNGLETKD
ncbi:MAG: GIY-YIG nuclease family protein [Candidatus Zambryskibacteria bacterium]|nr:GIY-YIG nuclease family protein [Candidatus Zambryskibacteria bacterium]